MWNIVERDQQVHIDVPINSKDVKRFNDDEPPSLVALLANQNATVLKVYPRSHRQLMGLIPETVIQPVDVSIPRGHAIVLDSRLAHAGKGYENMNLRSHLYLPRRYVNLKNNSVGYLTDAERAFFPE